MYRKRGDGFIKGSEYVTVDLISFHAALFLAYYVVSGNQFRSGIATYLNTAIVSTMAAFILYACTNCFAGIRKRGFKREAYSCAKQVFLLGCFDYLYLRINVSELLMTRLILTMMVFYFTLSLGVRTFVKYYFRENGRLSRPVSIVLITDVKHVSSIAKAFRSNELAYEIVGVSFVRNNVREKRIGSIPVIPYGEEFPEELCRMWVDEVFIDYCVPTEEAAKLAEVLQKMGVVVHMRIPDMLEGNPNRQFIENLSNFTVLTSTLNFADTPLLMVKRGMDILGGIVGTIITLLLAVVIGPFIMYESPGPLFYKQERVGLNGRRFKIIKFRSMYMDADQRKKELMEKNQMDSSFMFKMDEDPRIIGSKILPDGTYKKGIGNLIRDWSLDEFPQFLNVLMGDMSMVGTRPPTVDEWNQYELHHRARLAAKPGITGMWQTSGRSKITDFEEVVKLDTKYINEWSLLLDLKLLLKTVEVVIRRDGSM